MRCDVGCRDAAVVITLTNVVHLLDAFEKGRFVDFLRKDIFFIFALLVDRAADPQLVADAHALMALELKLFKHCDNLVGLECPLLPGRDIGPGAHLRLLENYEAALLILLTILLLRKRGAP